MRTAPSSPGASERRVLNPRPFRIFRKRYSIAEAKAGVLVLLGLVAVAAWVAWRGVHPEPGLVADPASTAKASGPAALPEIEGRRAPGESRLAGTGGRGVADAPEGAPVPASAPEPERPGPLRDGLAARGWTEGPVSRFDAENLYAKIDGRAEFFLSRGFRSLHVVTLSGPGAAAVDVEAYDLGSPDNALGAFSAERAPGTRSASGGGTSWYAARNALFLARGSIYVRAIGSEESPAVLAQLDALRKALDGDIAAGGKPWTATLFGDALGLPPDRVQYAAENAFSFGFAKNVTSATLDDGETELFVLPAGGEEKAKALAVKFEEGFLSYGEKADASGASWVKDRYLSTWSRTIAVGTIVVGVKGAPDPAKASEALAALGKAVRALPPEVARKAAAGPPAGSMPKGGGYE